MLLRVDMKAGADINKIYQFRFCMVLKLKKAVLLLRYEKSHNKGIVQNVENKNKFF